MARLFEMPDATMHARLKELEPEATEGRKRLFRVRMVHDLLRGAMLDPTAERARLQSAQADSQEMKNAVERGELLKAAEIERDIGRGLSDFKARMLAIPRSIAPLLVGLESASDAEAVVDEAVRNALEALAVVAEIGEAAYEAAAKANDKPVGGQASKAKPRSKRRARSMADGEG